MHPARQFVLPWLLGGAVLPAGAQGSPQQAVETFLSAYGGWERLKAVSSYRIEGAVSAGHTQSPLRTHRIWVRPDTLKVVIDHPDGREIRTISGTTGWSRAPSGKTAGAQGPLLDSMTLQRARASLPWILAEQRSDVRWATPLGLQDVKPEGLQLTLGEGLTLRVLIDPVTHRIRSAITVMEKGLPMAFETRFSDFREVEGILFAFQEENFVGGSRTASTKLTKIQLNPDIAPGEFER